MLSDNEILDRIRSGRIEVNPFNKSMLQPASLDLRLDRHFKTLRSGSTYIDPAEDQAELWSGETVGDGDWTLIYPHEFVLASTYEKVTLDAQHAARFEGKSSLGRQGLLTHITAGFIDPGFSGHITLELSNVTESPIKLYPGMKIGQICFIRLDTPATTPYGASSLGSHYQGQRGPNISRGWDGFTHGLPPC